MSSYYKPKGCTGRHAAWATGILLTVFGIAIPIFLGVSRVSTYASERAADQAVHSLQQLEPRLRQVEQDQAANRAYFESIQKGIDEIKADIRRDRTR